MKTLVNCGSRPLRTFVKFYDGRLPFDSVTSSTVRELGRATLKKLIHCDHCFCVTIFFYLAFKKWTNQFSVENSVFLVP